jgi:hydroxymethylglutaryl-CoA synthase
MKKQSVGISDIALYIPSPKITLDTIYETRVQQDPDFERRLRRAIDVTGQKAIRFPAVYEDNATIAANSAKRLLDQNSGLKLENLRYLTVGTETSVDMSKPISAYVEGMLQRAGYKLPTTISSFQVQHACAGGTLAMLSVGALLKSSPRDDEHGMVICSDIARYDAPSTAEITQGAGSASLLIEKDPALVELDLETQGYSSSDVDDFFRPLGSTTAKVKGRYSVECYHQALDEALADHASRVGMSVQEVIKETDMFVFHVPFAQMAANAIRRLLNHSLGMNEHEADNFLNARGFFTALEATAQVGNIYTGALYLNMAAQLAENYKLYGKDIVGKKMLITSYGSGNTMIVISGTVSPKAPEKLESWNVKSQLNHDRAASFDDYDKWIKLPTDPQSINSMIQDSISDKGNLPNDLFILEGIREDGYRQYSYRK